MLNELGYDAGTADGLMGSKTRNAIRSFQAHSGVAVSGEPTAELYNALASDLGYVIADQGPSGPTPMKQRWRSLVAACEGRGADEVTLVYGAEGEPPVELPVAPRLMYSAHKKGYLEAECLVSGVLKTYRMDRIHRVRARTR